MQANLSLPKSSRRQTVEVACLSAKYVDTLLTKTSTNFFRGFGSPLSRSIIFYIMGAPSYTIDISSNQAFFKEDKYADPIVHVPQVMML